MDRIYPQRLHVIQRVDKIISHRLLGEKHKKQRERVKTGNGLSRHKKETCDSRRKQRCDIFVGVNVDVSQGSTIAKVTDLIAVMTVG